MSSGAVHKKYNIIVGSAASVWGFFNLPFDSALAAVFGAILGTVITPDYDLNAALPASFMTRIPVVKDLWGVVWRPYQVIMKHRSFLSHAPVLSTAIRCIYVLGWIYCVLFVMNLWGIGPPASDLSKIIYQNFDKFAITFAVWSLQDFTHFVLDL